MPTPRPVTHRCPLGDGRVVRVLQPRDERDGTPVDPGSYEEIRAGFAPATEFEPHEPAGPAAVFKTLGGGVEIDPATKEIRVAVAPADTLALGVGRFVLVVRLERGAGTRHTLSPYHVLEITPSGLG